MKEHKSIFPLSPFWIEHVTKTWKGSNVLTGMKNKEKNGVTGKMGFIYTAFSCRMNCT